MFKLCSITIAVCTKLKMKELHNIKYNYIDA